MNRRLLLLVCSAAFAAIIVPTDARAACRSAQLCRSETPNGLHRQRGVWITPCGPNGERGGTDPICRDLAACPAAGGFGKFLAAVSDNCHGKTFDGYYGLDGLTFGILDFTSNELPTLFEIYKTDHAAKFNSIFGSLHLPMHGNCLDPAWVCNKNKAAYLNCDASFRHAFEQSVRDPDLQKAQIKLAMRQYQQRIRMDQGLGLHTQYGKVFLAVVRNNLPNRPACRPATWKQQCQATNPANEAALVDCMVQKYVDGSCRNSHAGAVSRSHSIAAVFNGHKNDRYAEPDFNAIVGCSSHWGASSGGRAPGHSSKKAPKKPTKKAKKH